MKEVNFDCLKDDDFVYDGTFSHRKEGNPDGCETKKPELRGKDELFAFKWPNLPREVKEAVDAKIRSMYGLSLAQEDVLRIFKCLVARDAEIPMPYVEVTERESEKKPAYTVKTFNEETFEWEDRLVAPRETAKTKAYTAHVYIGRTGRRDWLADGEGYAMIQSNNSNFLTEDRSEALLDSYEDAAAICESYAKRELLVYIGGPIRKGNVASRLIGQLKGRDWTKRGAVTVRKADFMACPREWDDRYYDWHNVDYELRNAIKKFSLSDNVDQGFIDWIASGCKTESGKRSKLSASNFKINNFVDFPELTRANVVDCYHGMPGDFLNNLKEGSTFSAGTSKYVVVKTAVVDHEKVVAYAKDGTAIDGRGFISAKNIQLGIDEDSIEECWDCLFDVNRIGRKKKFLKNPKTERANGKIAEEAKT